ncbi:S8 family serine peptidase [Micromonospora sp. DR5-3]|uniref:S8 family serine peptidase n=1 Tax=unclassified Micromonospora TaxID=2617518 RepID=UPI0011D78DD3|nr:MULTISPECIES: S8 family serine peptidase [unclassified Micromonospora]MCW3818558.1 S8 family serine peptidase [Micromonospora sp. DR5-3]TYC20140.1 S8 family serine peptidase [Micromonospora sp. MP36]
MSIIRLLTGAAVATTLVAAVATPAQAATNDPLYDKQWALRQINAEQAWATSTGAGVVIAVVDTGVDLGHPDLSAKLVPGATFVDCGPTSCGNGDWRGPNGTADAGDEHGTHVAGIAAAATGNGVGVAGVAPDAKIMPIKVLEAGSGSFADIAAGIRYAADHGAKVINLSLGALPGLQALTLTGLESDATAAIAYAQTKGVAVVAAAGNETAPLCDTPAWEAGALCVTATDRNEVKAWYANLGVKTDLKAVAAPGGAGLVSCDDDVWSSVPVGTGSAGCGQGNYDAYAGTSMATPAVSGVAALLFAQGRSLDNVYSVLMSTARTPVLGLRGVYSPVYGWGIVDAQAAVAAPRT